MSVAVCRGPAVPAFVEAPSWMRPAELFKPEPLADDRPAQVDIWNAIQADVDNKASDHGAKKASSKPYVRRSSSSSRLMSQRSLEICTESLGSETGSDGFSDAGTDRQDSDDDEHASEEAAANLKMPARAFPPPLPSLARRTVASTLQMRQHRRDGRLLVEAVPVLSTTLFRAQRRGGRLLLCFADTASDQEKSRGPEPESDPQAEQETHEEDVVVEEEEDEEVEVVDRGTVVEVKVVSTQPQAHSTGARVHRSSLVINKFVGAEPVGASEINDAAAPQKVPSTPPTVAAAAASALSAAQVEQLPEEGDDGTTSVGKPSEGKLLMTTRRRRSKQELLNHMRRCGQLSGQLFIWEPRVATSS